jgi:hypothetical protein
MCPIDNLLKAIEPILKTVNNQYVLKEILPHVQALKELKKTLLTKEETKFIFEVVSVHSAFAMGTFQALNDAIENNPVVIAKLCEDDTCVDESLRDLQNKIKTSEAICDKMRAHLVDEDIRSMLSV